MKITCFIALIRISLLSCAWITCQAGTPGAEKLAVTASVSGDGPDHVVMLSGLSEPSVDWKQTQEFLQKNYTVHVLAVPGIGSAPTRPCQCTTDIDSVSNAVGDYVAEHLKRPPLVIAHSAGGLAALHLARDRPGILAGVVVVDALPFMAANSGVTEVSPDWVQSTQESVAGMLSESPDQFFARIRDQIRTSIGDQSIALALAERISKSDRAVYASLYRSALLSDLRKLGPLTDVPIYVIYADQGPLGAPPGFMRRRYLAQYDWLPQDHLLEVEDSRHYVMLDRTSEFERLIGRILNSALPLSPH